MAYTTCIKFLEMLWKKLSVVGLNFWRQNWTDRNKTNQNEINLNETK